MPQTAQYLFNKRTPLHLPLALLLSVLLHNTSIFVMSPSFLETFLGKRMNDHV